MVLVASNKKGKGYFNSYILRRIKNNQNFLACITGGTGSGKSYSALREGEILDPNFSIENVCFTPQQLMDLINGVKKKLKKGACILYDEVQVTHGHLDYRSLQSKLLNYLLQTFRHRNFILFMTSPFFSYINASARKLFHSRWETVSMNRKLKLCKLKALLLQTNQSTGKVYQKYLRVVVKGQGVMPLKSVSVRLPSQKLIDDYEKKKTEFTNELNIKITKELKEVESGEPKPKPLTTRQQAIYDFIKEGGNLTGMVKEFNIVPQTLKDHIEFINKKIEHNEEVIERVMEDGRVIGYAINQLKVVEVGSD